MGQDLISDPDAVAALERADALHTALTHIVLEGGDLGRIAEEVGHALHCGVVFTTTDGREQAAHLDQESRQSLVEADLIDPTGRLRVERTYDGAPVGTGEALGLRVGAAGVDLARLVAIGPSRIHPSDVHALERTAIVAALLITREQAVAAVENKYRGDFLRDVFLRRAGSDHYVAEHAQAFGWDLERHVVVVVAELDSDRVDGESVPGPQRRTLQDRFANAWRQVSSGIDRQIASVDFSSEVVTLLPVIGGPVSGGPVSGGPVSGGPVSDGPGVVATEALVRQAVEAVRGDRGGGRVSFSVGVSRLALGSAELPLAYQQARRAVEVGRRVRGSGSTTYFDQLGVHRLLALVPDPAELSAYVADVLGPLAERTPEAADLRATLQVLLDTNFNVAEAARAQFFHYNTMRYRVGKLQRLLGPVASDPHLRLDVAVALRALEIVG